MIPRIHAELQVSSEAAQLATLRAFVRTFCGDAVVPALDDDSVDQLELAVNEAASNIMRHAYRGRTNHSIQMEMEAYPDTISVLFRHTGEPFDPDKVAPPVFDGTREGGFGIYFINLCVDEVRYFQDSAGRNCVHLIKSRNRPQQSNPFALE